MKAVNDKAECHQHLKFNTRNSFPVSGKSYSTRIIFLTANLRKRQWSLFIFSKTVKTFDFVYNASQFGLDLSQQLVNDQVHDFDTKSSGFYVSVEKNFVYLTAEFAVHFDFIKNIFFYPFLTLFFNLV